MPLLSTLANASARGYGAFGGVAASTNSYESIATVTVGAGGSSTITFSSIPSTYKHLQIRVLARTNRNVSDGDYLYMRFNSISSTASYYGQHYLRGNGSTATAAADGTFTASYLERFPALNTTASVFGVGIVDILDYTNTNKNKVWRSLAGYDANGDANANIRLASGMLLSTPAISQIDITSGSGSNFVQYSQFALYGIKG